jgi:hypothetical protein
MTFLLEVAWCPVWTMEWFGVTFGVIWCHFGSDLVSLAVAWCHFTTVKNGTKNISKENLRKSFLTTHHTGNAAGNQAFPAAFPRNSPEFLHNSSLHMFNSAEYQPEMLFFSGCSWIFLVRKCCRKSGISGSISAEFPGIPAEFLIAHV